MSFRIPDKDSDTRTPARPGKHALDGPVAARRADRSAQLTLMPASGLLRRCAAAICVSRAPLRQGVYVRHSSHPLSISQEMDRILASRGFAIRCRPRYGALAARTTTSHPPLVACATPLECQSRLVRAPEARTTR